MTSVHFMSEKHDWETPQDLFDQLNAEFSFTLDAAATYANAKCKRFFDLADNALTKQWRGNVFCNPPYGRELPKFVRHAYEQSLMNEGGVIVMLIPARTDTSYWHDYIQPHAQIRFLRGRIKFEVDGKAGNPAPFPSAIVIFRGGDSHE